ncbi:hypothetical protein SMSP2_01413 [Limihaloglobus sulfuriphilus]|uniref:DUF2264 domain-containing protein n=1 Tax=Limihaloglobus sulfuriphilus TaxID=1851148 RepID=A0A1Q2MEH3_9BACT|nr:DUF2264 domain-containing protein [Limihaloglobus sulfuriphilus]AQQ71049.1 hypothetical protein SMSP2_01413 [Limihaloglobus sulfuriphilus]
MQYFDLPITKNPVKTRKDVQTAVSQLCSPLKDLYSPGCARVYAGTSGANYEEIAAVMESFSRPLWGLVPLVAGGGETELWDKCIEGIKNGTDPQHPEYWGKIWDVDQRVVEMPPLALGLSLGSDVIWDSLDEKQKKNFVCWLDQCNDKELPDCNWKFMAILVNMAFQKLGLDYNKERNDEYLQRMEDFYISDGWYSDGYKREQRDYYIPFAMHYYALIYAHLMSDIDPERSRRFRERAAEFAKDFIYWFASDGSAVPFGRSLTYRFAQGAFWGALAFADVDAFDDWGIVKGLYLRHLRWWLRQPIYYPNGIMSIGYCYPNLFMSEIYNAPGSPYWAFKAFLPLALDEQHPFWQAEEKPLPELKATVTLEHCRMTICRDKDHVFSLTSGQFPGMEFSHNAAKYSKFAYSNRFGFSVPREMNSLEQGAFDSTLALIEQDDNVYRTRRKCEQFEISPECIYSLWRPWNDVSVKTWLIAANPWHVRVHLIDSRRKLVAAEGGFALSREEDLQYPPDSETIHCENSLAAANYPWGTSVIADLLGKRDPQIIKPSPNTNLIHQRTAIPMLTGQLDKGISLLVCAVRANTDTELSEMISAKPTATVESGSLKISIPGAKSPVFECDIPDLK